MLLPYVKMLMTKLLHRLNVYNYGPYVKMLMTKLLHRLNVYNYGSYFKMLMAKCLNYLQSVMNSSHTGTRPKHEKKDDESNINLPLFDSEDDESTDPDDCCHHIEKVSTSI
jgi:hypothetical protein